MFCRAAPFSKPFVRTAYHAAVPLRHVTKISDLTKDEMLHVIALAQKMKANKEKYYDALKHRSLMLFFEKPSLRTRVSFEVGMFELGGHAIAYNAADSPLGGKETVEDFAKVVSRFVDVIMARVKTRDTIRRLCENASIPVINGLDDFAHPMQILADMLTITEKKGSTNGIKLAFVGDCQNNMTYDLMRSAAVLGFRINVAGPSSPEFFVEPEVIDECKALGGDFHVGHDAVEAVKNADVVYADSWMSYHIDPAKKQKRYNTLLPFQVTTELMSHAKKDAVFMNCLPAMRGEEQTAEVVDGPQSIVFDQAENRLHAQKAMLACLLTNFAL